MKLQKKDEQEEKECTCGAGHGSLEGHTDWCEWLEKSRKAKKTQTPS